MNMKTFITTTLLLGVTMFGQELVAQENPSRKEIGLQLYSVRDLMASQANTNGDGASYQPVLNKIAKIGYTAVEAAGYQDGKFYNTDPKEFKKNVEKAGMQILSSHCMKPLSKEELASGDFSQSLKWWNEAIAAHKAAGMMYIVTPWLDTPKTLKELKTQCDYLNEVGKLCRAQGIKYGYHNHAHEFQKIEGKDVMLDYMLENTDAENVFFEMDVYWAVIGKASPVDYFTTYPGRFTTLHIKDNREIGQSGMVGFDAIFKNAELAGVKHVFVEIEEVTKDIETSLRQSLQYLSEAEFVKQSYSK